MFARQMYTLLKSGVPLMRALVGLQESSRSGALAKVLQDLRTSLDSGRDLSSSMRRHPDVFSQFFVSMVRVGEMSGRLEEIFLRLFNHLEFEKDMKERVQQALRYPAFVLVAMAVAIVIVNLFVIPAFAKLFSGLKADLPWLTQLLIQFSNFMVSYWSLLLALAILSVIAFRVYTGTPGGRYNWDRFKLGCRSPARSSKKSRWRGSRAAFQYPRKAACRWCRRSPCCPRLSTIATSRNASNGCVTASSAERAFCTRRGLRACSLQSCCRCWRRARKRAK